MTAWHQLPSSEVLQQLNVNSAAGLAEAEAQRRLAEYGPNELAAASGKGIWKILWEQVANTLVVVLAAAAIGSAILGDYQDAIAIFAILAMNTLLGGRQQHKAERAIAALRKIAEPNARVRRGGAVQEIAARALVPGDILLLEAGNLVPADARLLETSNLRLQETALTGESAPIDKDARATVAADAPLGDRFNMVFKGTPVSYGHGTAVIVETGMRTELGHIAGLVQRVEQTRSPLERRLDRLGRALVVAALGVTAVVFVAGLLRGESMRLMFLTAVSLAVAAVPEGLPAVVTIALALGAQRMLKRKALIRSLPAVETLGSVTTICSDKTGTLTENQMTVTVLYVPDRRFDLPRGPNYGGAGPESQSAIADLGPGVALLLCGGALCNDAMPAGDGKEERLLGDPTEIALINVASRAGFRKPKLEEQFARISDLPFDSERKRMSTLHQLPADGTRLPAGLSGAWESLSAGAATHLCFTKGAVDGLLDVSTHVWAGDRTELLDESWRKRIVAVHDALAADGIRVLGLSFRPVVKSSGSPEQDGLREQDLIFAGLFGMIDPPRREARPALETCEAAGIRTIMITGDHPLTARHIARELGLGRGGGRVLTGQEMERISAPELREVMAAVDVCARVSPEHKLRIVEALQQRGQSIAMTGDGVNDAPALKKADIGIAMGIVGTDVAREAADMVLLDDNFATIVAAVEEGRVIFDNIRRFVQYLLAGNSAELWVMLLGPLAGMPLPLLPIQILWINLITDGLPALALGVEPAEPDVMQRPPISQAKGLFGRSTIWDITLGGLLMGLASLGAGYLYWVQGNPGWQTMVFTTLTLSEMFLALAVRSHRESLFRIGLTSNKPMLAAISGSLLLQVGLLYLPVVQPVFRTMPLAPKDLFISAALASLSLWAFELKKLWLRRRGSPSPA